MSPEQEARLEEIREYQTLPKGHLERYELVEDLLAMVDGLRGQLDKEWQTRIASQKSWQEQYSRAVDAEAERDSLRDEVGRLQVHMVNQAMLYAGTEVPQAIRERDSLRAQVKQLREALVAVHNYDVDNDLLCWGMAPCCLMVPPQESPRCDQARAALAASKGET